MHPQLQHTTSHDHYTVARMFDGFKSEQYPLSQERAEHAYQCGIEMQERVQMFFVRDGKKELVKEHKP